jgi:hypothetical protein
VQMIDFSEIKIGEKIKLKGNWSDGSEAKKVLIDCQNYCDNYQSEPRPMFAINQQKLENGVVNIDLERTR